MLSEIPTLAHFYADLNTKRRKWRRILLFILPHSHSPHRMPSYVGMYDDLSPSYIGQYDVISLRQHWFTCQRLSGDLYLWHRGCATRVAWYVLDLPFLDPSDSFSRPTDENGAKIPATDLLHWLRERRLVWACRCTSHGSHSLVQFTRNNQGDVVAICSLNCPFLRKSPSSFLLTR